MPNVAEIIREHVTLAVKCVDRLYLNGSVPRLQSSGGVVTFLTRARGRTIPSPAVFGEITESFKTRLRAWCQARHIPWIDFKKGERKDDVVQPYRDRFQERTGVVLVGVAQERASARTATKTQQGRHVDFTDRRKSVCVNHSYIYLIDPEWGPAFIKVCGYAPYAMKLCLNGHEWGQAAAAATPAPVHRAGQRVSRLCRPGHAPGRLRQPERGRHRGLLHAMAGSAAADDPGLRRRLHVSPLAAPDGGEPHPGLRPPAPRPGVLRGGPARQPRPRAAQPAPGPVPPEDHAGHAGAFATRIGTHGVAPSLHVEYKRCHIKQSVKEERALRTETPVNDPDEFGIGRGGETSATSGPSGSPSTAASWRPSRPPTTVGWRRPTLRTSCSPRRRRKGKPPPA